MINIVKFIFNNIILLWDNLGATLGVTVFFGIISGFLLSFFLQNTSSHNDSLSYFNFEPLTDYKFVRKEEKKDLLHAKAPSIEPKKNDATNKSDAKQSFQATNQKINTCDLSLKKTLLKLIDTSIDDPDWDKVSKGNPNEVMFCLESIYKDHFSSKRVLEKTIAFLATQDLSSKQLSSKSAGLQPSLNPWLVAFSKSFFAPDILSTIDGIYRQLQLNINEIDRPNTQKTPDGRLMPRKKNIDAQGNLVSYGRIDATITTAQNKEELQKTKDRYLLMFYQMAEHFYWQSALVNSYEFYAKAMLLDFENWKNYEKGHLSFFLDSATFMVLSAHKTEQVMNLYSNVLLDEVALQKRILQQVEHLTEIYSKAKIEFSNNAAISQGLADLLHTLIEDSSIDDILPPEEKKRFLALIGNAAISKRQYQEAIGVYAASGQTKELISLGKMLSESVYYSRQNVITINRDIEFAIDAFREAGDIPSMMELLERCETAYNEISKNQELPQNFVYLVTYINQLSNATGRNINLKNIEKFTNTNNTNLENSRNSSDKKTSNNTTLQTQSLEQIKNLIKQILDKIKNSPAGSDILIYKVKLAPLLEQAIFYDDINTAIEATSIFGDKSTEFILEIGRTLVAKKEYLFAFKLFKAIDRNQSHQSLFQLASHIISQGLEYDNIFNKNIEIAVDALLIVEANEEISFILQELVELNSKFLRIDSSLKKEGKPSVDRNQKELESCINKIKQIYDIEGQGKSKTIMDKPSTTNKQFTNIENNKDKVDDTQDNNDSKNNKWKRPDFNLE